MIDQGLNGARCQPESGVGSSGEAPELPFRIAGIGGWGRYPGWHLGSAKRALLHHYLWICSRLTLALNVNAGTEMLTQWDTQYATMASLLPMPHETPRSPVKVAGACFGQNALSAISFWSQVTAQI